MKSLEGNGPVVLEVSGQEYRRHAAAPEFALNGIGARDAGFQQSSEVCHCDLALGEELATLGGYTAGVWRARSGDAFGRWRGPRNRPTPASVRANP
jgi:hypothetical protein